MIVRQSMNGGVLNQSEQVCELRGILNKYKQQQLGMMLCREYSLRSQLYLCIHAYSTCCRVHLDAEHSTFMKTGAGWAG